MGVLLKKSELHVSVKRTDFYAEAQSDFFPPIDILEKLIPFPPPGK